jgi:hypothetical protein
LFSSADQGHRAADRTPRETMFRRDHDFTRDIMGFPKSLAQYRHRFSMGIPVVQAHCTPGKGSAKEGMC